MNKIFLYEDFFTKDEKEVVSFGKLYVLDDSLVGEFLSHEFQLGIPIFAEAADEGFLEELVDGEVFFLALEHSHFAYVPAVVVEGTVGTILAHTDGVEVAGNGLHERSFSCSPRLFQCAITNAVFVVASEYAVFSIDNRGHVVAIDVLVRDALLVDEGTGFQ